MKSLLLTLLLSQQFSGVLINVNTATKAELLGIEGMTSEMADRIIKHRPYKVLDDVHRGVTIFEFQKIQARLFADSPVSSVFPPPPSLVIPPPSARREIQIIQGNQLQRLQFEPKREDAPKP